MKSFVFALALLLCVVSANACDIVLNQSSAVVLGSPVVQYAPVAVQSFAVQAVAVHQPVVQVQAFAQSHAFVQAQAVALGGCRSGACGIRAAAVNSGRAVRSRAVATSGGLFGFGLIGPNRSRAVSVR